MFTKLLREPCPAQALVSKLSEFKPVIIRAESIPVVTALSEAMEEDDCVQVSLRRIDDSRRGRYSNGGGDHCLIA